MARINREHDLLVQERSMAAARESALVSFLQKMNQQQNPQNPSSTNPPPAQIPIQLPQNPQPPLPPPPPASTQVITTALTPTPLPPQPFSNLPRSDNGGESFTPGTASSRWPKTEVQALIQLRTNLDNKYQENGPKGPLWEDISSGMRRLGYNRSSKRCKEKWENINKYFKKVKESNKKRPEDSKTCPYFHQLDALYREKAIRTDRPENSMAPPIMVRPEQQWPLPLDQQQQRQDQDGDNIEPNDDDEDDDDGGGGGDSDDGDEDEEDEGSGYEIVTNKAPSAVAAPS